MTGGSDGVRPPQQARSQGSTDRMLDAALTLLDRDGIDGMTIAAVSRLAHVSNGAIYHRFADRRSLLLAAQDRFLSQLETDWLTAAAPIWAIPDPDELVAAVVERYLQVFTAHRRTFRAFLMGKDADVELRSRGLAASEHGARFIVEQLVARFGCTPEVGLVAYQLLHAQAILIALFDDTELPARTVPPGLLREALALAMTAALRGAGPGDREGSADR